MGVGAGTAACRRRGTLARASLPAGVAAQSFPAASPPLVDGVVLVGFTEDATRPQRAAAAASVGADDLGIIGAGTHVLRVPVGAVLQVVAALRARSDVRYAEPDWVGHADAVPNDPSFNLQWAFENTGASFDGL